MSHAGWVYPNTGGAHTLTFNFFLRANKGMSFYASAAAYISNLTLVFPNGHSEQLPLDAIGEILVQHVLNSGIAAWWSPPVGTIEDNLRAVFSDLAFATSPTTTKHVYFDGQAGPVRCG